ncbi:putative fad binding domain-containing protein [Daldinia childiae]|uniref:putative fad binding domain-containing protein n=1 Tax=Daldinia childiae TaxID=326645 RepID=UPI0014487E22|nr:putative fad binding domain-containing protein [Daldinia childiae]KAF3055203.1 putative fad binding domain-containing protein [Daldinia childiae]
MRILVVQTLFVLFTSLVYANFAFEAEQLTEDDIGDFSAIAFSNISAAASPNGDDRSDCREYPGTPNWPLDEEWSRLNRSLGGALIKGVPPAAVCYDGPYKDDAACTYLMWNATFTRFYINDPVTVFSEWPEGDTCHTMFGQQAGGNCTQGAFPVYVVNATTVRQIQIAVNFARNRNLRLVIKNTGHDFVGRSSGFGSLSIWTHWLKDFEFLPRYRIGAYNGRAARVGAGIESWEMFEYMSRYNMTALVAGGYTVGAYGGWIAGGGHSALASKYGLGADQALSIQVVTADGRFVTADPHQNTDLFYALRGGGGSTYGVVTSFIIKVHPPTTVLASSIAFFAGGFNISGPSDTKNFWKGFDLYHEFGKKIVDNGGTACYVSRLFGNSSFSFTADIELPNVSEEYLFEFVQPLVNDLNAIGLNVTNQVPHPATNWASLTGGTGDIPGSSRFGSRLWPRANFEDPDLFKATQLAIRESIEAGYTFHGIHMKPTEEVAGYPGNNAVNPAFRKAIIHADLYDYSMLRGLSPADFKATHAQLASAMDKWRAVSPGAGAYFNECDVQEPNWQQAFFGSNYGRLLRIKRRYDPWGVFYAPTTVGSEDWVVLTEDEMPTQNGPLCRANSAEVRRGFRKVR